MKTFRQSTQYRKDLKRYKRKPQKIARLLILLNLLAEDAEIPESYKMHLLTGDYSGHWECHIENDFLLIWIDTSTDEITLVRMGTHADLFEKGAKR